MAIINALTDTWNNVATTFTAIKMTVTDTTSAAGSKLIDLLVGASSKFSVDKTGQVFTPASGGYFMNSSNGEGIKDSGGIFVAVQNSTDIFAIAGGTHLRTISGLNIGWTSSTTNPAVTGTDLGMARKAAKVHEFNSGTNGTYAGVAWGSGSQTVAQLPAAGTAGAGARTFVTDATATTFLSTVAGGGANKVPVVSDGTNWLIG